ncbi:hypothetical protein [uncultured Bosea sp.]|uniref:hypothetical protein n=1 Tax=uncultured Bosea sp. TaxID=211457 RepID=UPI00263BC9C5|nr:hypothetical protein [uncultured Bosea sp.]
MLPLADLLAQLQARGLDEDILRLVEAKLTVKPRPTSKYVTFVSNELSSARQEERIQEKETDEKRRIRKAISAIWPDQIPERLGKKARIDLIKEHIKTLELPPVSTSTIERELGYRKRASSKLTELTKLTKLRSP